jgi:glycogen(starch) synthase
MNIVLVTYEFPPVTSTGGIGSYMYHLSVLLASKGHKVTVFSANPNVRELVIAEQKHCTNYLVPAQNNDTFREAVGQAFELFVETNKVEVIESPEVGACAWFINKKFPEIPLVVKMHTPGVLISKVSNTYLPLAKKVRFVVGALLCGRWDAGYWAGHDKNKDIDLEYRICMRADTLLSPSSALKHWAVKFWGIPSTKIQILQNPFSIEDALFSLPLSNRPAAISFVGKLSILKGMKALTKAIPKIMKKNKGCKVFIIGRDEIENGKSMKEYMQKELSEYKSDIVFTGALNKEALKEIYAQSKVCVFPSLWENYPTVILEAMASGAAVTASNVGGIPEIIAHNVTGLLFRPRRPRQIAKAVNNLLENEDRRLVMVQTARKELKKRMSEASFGDEQLRVYTKFEKFAAPK